jgi:hypothetical protein
MFVPGIAQHSVQVIQKPPVDEQTWVTNCGRNVSHHSGYLPLLARLNVICKSKGQKRRSSGVQGTVFTLGLLKKKYQFAPKKLDWFYNILVFVDFVVFVFNNNC